MLGEEFAAKKRRGGLMVKGKFLISSVLLLTIISLGGFHKAKEACSTQLPGKKVIAFAQFKQETNIFSPVKTTLREFQASGLYYGPDILEYGLKEELAGFMAAVKKFGQDAVEAVPVLKASSTSGGPIDAEVYYQLKQDLINGLKEIGDLDGIYLSMHGAMGVEGLYDPETDLLQALRDEFGEELPIGISYDLHANVTEGNVRLATFIVGYKTNPHRDQFAAGYRSGEILVKTVLGEVKPVMAFQKMRLLKGGGMNMDFLPPMNKIFKRMKQMEKQEEVLCVSNFMVHIWLDEPELGWSTVVVTDGNKTLAEELSVELAEMNWAVRDYKHAQPYTPSEAIAIARSKWLWRKLGTVMFCDSSDAIGAGAPGENTWILKALLEEGSDLISYVPLRDAEAAVKAFTTPLNETITLTVGGKLEQTYNRPLTVTGKVIHKTETELYGKIAVLKIDGVHLILMELPDSLRYPKFFKDLGLSLWQADIVVAKNLFPFRIWYLPYNRKTIDVATPGTTNVNVYELHYRNIPRPIYPLDDIDDWR